MRKTKAETEKTKILLIDSALTVFLKKGYSTTTLEDIVKQAGMTRGAFYWHFKSKLDLHHAICRRETERVQGLIDVLLGNNLPPFEKLQHFLFEVINNFYTNKRFNQYIELTRLKSESGFLHELSENKSGTFKLSLTSLEELLKQCQNENKIKATIDAKLISKQIHALVAGLYRLYFTAKPHYNSLEESQAMFKQYLDLITQK